MSRMKGPKNAHSSNAKMGMGDHLGTGIRAPLGRIRDGMGMKEIKPSKLKKPPRSLA